MLYNYYYSASTRFNFMSWKNGRTLDNFLLATTREKVIFIVKVQYSNLQKINNSFLRL